MSFDLSQLLEKARAGDDEAVRRVFPLVYDELRRLAAHYLRGEHSGHTLQATALVNEAFMKLVGGEPVSWESKTHFFNTAARAMRQILIDHARTKKRIKRGGGAGLGSLDTGTLPPMDPGPDDLDLLALDDALNKLARLDERQARLVELRFFAGLTESEAAEVLGVSRRTVSSEWVFVLAWLKNEMAGAAADDAG
jgi:RNA polymerase sigma factor (TIGR02999 family)